LNQPCTHQYFIGLGRAIGLTRSYLTSGLRPLEFEMTAGWESHRYPKLTFPGRRHDEAGYQYDVNRLRYEGIVQSVVKSASPILAYKRYIQATCITKVKKKIGILKGCAHRCANRLSALLQITLQPHS
jgi:agmatine/peptidylarginine deiminase